jgi:hypothetical protein
LLSLLPDHPQRFLPQFFECPAILIGQRPGLKLREQFSQGRPILRSQLRERFPRLHDYTFFLSEMWMKRDSSNLKSDGVSVELIISDPFCRTIKEALRSGSLLPLPSHQHVPTTSRKAKIHYPVKK